MPSSKNKAKRASRAPSTPTAPLFSPSGNSPLQIASPSPSPSHADDDEQSITDALHRAALRFPGLISEHAFRGKVVEGFREKRAIQDTRAIVFISKPAMLSHSLSPGILVSVSLARRLISSDDFPLESFANMWEKYLEVEMNDVKAGSYFALATVWPCPKLQNNEIRLSECLSYTVGQPTHGRTAFIAALKVSILSDYAKKILSPPSPVASLSDEVVLNDCINLKLKWLSPRKGSEVFQDSDTESYGSSENWNASPKTPAEYKSRSRIIERSPLGKNAKDNSSANFQSAIASASKATELATYVDMHTEDTLRKVLEDTNMVQFYKKFGVRWLGSRILLEGNIVFIHIWGKIHLFTVENGNISSANGLEHIHEHSLSLLDAPSPNGSVKTQCEEPLLSYCFIVGPETNIDYITSRDVVSKPPEKKGPDKTSDVDKLVKFSKMVDSQGAFALGGLSEQIAELKEIINFSLKKPQMLKRFNLQPTRGVLLYGPPGTGKTSLASACAVEAGVEMFIINGPEIISQYYGESEQALSAVFKAAESSAPSVVFIDELDAIAPVRKDGTEELSQRMVAALISLIDGIVKKSEGILVIAATNRPDFIDRALRTPGRLDKELEIGVPSSSQRYEILEVILQRMKHSLTSEEMTSLAADTHGFVGADISALCNEAALSALRRYIIENASSNNNLCSQKSVTKFFSELTIASNKSVNKSHLFLTMVPHKDENDAEATEEVYTPTSHLLLSITMEDFQLAKLKVRPSAMREVMLEIPKVRWSDIGGQAEVKQQLKEAVEWPQKHHDAFKQIGTNPPKGVLMFGPPGCSKTLMARAVASEAGTNFLAVKGPELFSKWVGETEKAIKSLFKKARAVAPSVIFFDEIDGLAQARENGNSNSSVGNRVMSQLLVEMDGLEPRVQVTVIAATNRPDKIDRALLRPGRFDRLVYVGPPSVEDRKEIFDIHMRNMSCSNDISLTDLAAVTDGYTGADIFALCRQAGLVALEEDINAREISMHHFLVALKHIQPTDILHYANLGNEFQRIVSRTVQLKE